MDKELFIEKLVRMNNDTQRLNEIKKKLKLSSTGKEKRFDFFKKRAKYIKYYNYFVKVLNELRVPYYIKGSSAWWSNLNSDGIIKESNNKTCEEVLLHLEREYEENIDEIASFLPQNWDFSIFVKTGYKDKVMQQLIQQLGVIKKKMNSDKHIFPPGRILRSKTNEEPILGFEINSKEYGSDTFKGSYISFCRIENRENNKYEHFNDENVCTGQIKLDQKDKIGFLLFWITIHEVPDMDKFYNNFLKPITIKKKSTIFNKELDEKIEETYFLNIDGLLLGNIYMESKGVNRSNEKQLKVDELRLNSINQYKTAEDKFNKLNYLYNFWIKNFKQNELGWSNTDYKKFFKEYENKNIVNGIKKLILKNVIDDKSKIGGITYLEQSLVNNYRPVINNIIIELSKLLKKTKIEGISKIDMFIVGGDAFTRYIENSKISDIDIKLQLTPEANHNKQRNIDQKIKKNIEELIIRFLSPYVIYLNYIGKFHNGPSFRIRQFDNTREDSPYNLFSLDCKSSHSVPKLMKDFYMEYAILDISIGYNYNKHDYKKDYEMMKTDAKLNMSYYFFQNYNDNKIKQIKQYINNIFLQATLPVATRKFLLEDLQKTYENESAMEGRLLAGKIEKDMRRYKQLKSQINSSSKIIKYNISDPFLIWTMFNQPDISKTLSLCGCLYYNMFIELYKKIRGKKKKITYTSSGYSYCNKDLNVSDAQKCLNQLYPNINIENFIDFFCKVMDKNNTQIQSPFYLISNSELIKRFII